MNYPLFLLTAAAALGQSVEPRIIVESMPEFGRQLPVVFRFDAVPASGQNAFFAWFVPDSGWFTSGCGGLTPDGAGRYAVSPSVWATKFFFANLPAGSGRPCLAQAESLPDAVANAAVRLLMHRSAPYRTIQFSGRTWRVKGLVGYPVGPGPNLFSPSPQNIWVDEQGRLHLRVAPCGTTWCSAEVILNESLGYGRYQFEIDTPLANLHQNAVLGMFTWSEDAARNHREIDMEVSRWAGETTTNAQFVVQPYWQPGNLRRFNAPTTLTPTTWWFDWSPQSVDFEMRYGPERWHLFSYTQAASIPPAGDERVRINLYWYLGQPGGVEQEVIIRSFSFTPSDRFNTATGTLDLLNIPALGFQNQRLKINQANWTFQLPLNRAFQPYPISGTYDTDVWFTLHPLWQPRDRTFTAKPGTVTVNFHQLGHTGTTEQRMVGMLYYNFFARLPAPEEVDFQVTEGLHKGFTAGAIAGNLFNSTEFNENGRFVAGLYTGLLCRDAEYDGWRFQLRALASGFTTQTTLIQNFLDSAEYRLRNGTPTDAQFVTLLYRCVLGRDPTVQEVNVQAAETARIGRVAMARAFLNSQEFRIGSGPGITAFLLYATLLNRDGAPEERAGWAGQIRNGLPARNAIDAFAGSAEFPLAFR